MKINLMCARVVLVDVWVCRCVDTGEKPTLTVFCKTVCTLHFLP